MPILFHADATKDLSNVMLDLKKSLALSVERFDGARSKLSSLLTGTNSHLQTMRYIDTCRTTVTGLLAWSLSTQRYNFLRYSVEGQIVVTLWCFESLVNLYQSDITVNISGQLVISSASIDDVHF